MFQVKPFKEIIAMSKEKFDETMAPIRARSAKAKADLKSAEIDERLIKLEQEIYELCAKRELNFDHIADKMDAYELLERRKKQVDNLISALFPAE